MTTGGDVRPFPPRLRSQIPPECYIITAHNEKTSPALPRIRHDGALPFVLNRPGMAINVFPLPGRCVAAHSASEKRRDERSTSQRKAGCRVPAGKSDARHAARSLPLSSLPHCSMRLSPSQARVLRERASLRRLTLPVAQYTESAIVIQPVFCECAVRQTVPRTLAAAPWPGD